MAIPDATAEPVARRSGRLLVACLVEVSLVEVSLVASWFFRLDNRAANNPQIVQSLRQRLGTSTKD